MFFPFLLTQFSFFFTCIFVIKMPVCSRVGHRSLVLVVFIGGVTSAEIAALRFLSAQVNIGKIISIFFQML
jgi:hypothetical protein